MEKREEKKKKKLENANSSVELSLSPNRTFSESLEPLNYRNRSWPDHLEFARTSGEIIPAIGITIGPVGNGGNEKSGCRVLSERVRGGAHRLRLPREAALLERPRIIRGCASCR